MSKSAECRITSETFLRMKFIVSKLYFLFGNDENSSPFSVLLQIG